jgi:hypothetical protein
MIIVFWLLYAYSGSVLSCGARKMLELLYYFFLLGVSYFFALKRVLFEHAGVFFSVWALLFLGLSLVVRAEYDVDINNYADAMSFSGFSIYFLKEPVVWLGQRYLFYLTESTYTTFIVYDMLGGILLFTAFRRMSVPQYAYFAVLLFFPFVLGMQNVYRQWFSSLFFLSAFSLVLVSSSQVKRFLAFSLSVLSHNVAAVFLPIFFTMRSRFSERLFWFLSFLVAFFGIYYGASTKSSADTGANMTAAYLLLLFAILLLFVMMDRGLVRGFAIGQYRVLLTLMGVGVFAALVLAGAGSERVMMFALMILFPVISVKLEDRLRYRVFARVLFISFGFFPIFLFGTRQFLVN